ncbi:hypothetical protein ACWD01_16275 [Streptomyces sp. NPDC002835]
MISPEKIPVFTGDLPGLGREIIALRQAAKAVRDGGGDVHTRFQNLASSYRAPEAGQLFSTTQAVQEGSGRFADRLETVAGALETYALEVVEIVKQLDLLRFQATRFVESVRHDDGPLGNWRKDQAKVDEHQGIWDGVNAAVAAFQAAEVGCADKITALVDGTRWHINDGSPEQQNAYGFSAEQLAEADSLPWGRPEHREIYPFGIDHHLKQAGISMWDNAAGSVEGLIDLFSPGEEGGAAREGLLRVIVGAEGYLLDPNGDRDDIAPAQKKLMDDSKPYAKEFAKAFVGWDDWGSNPGKAMGTVIFNGLTLGAGPLGAASKAGSAAGKAGTASRVAGAAAKIGEVLDPIGAAAKTAGVAARGLPRVAELTAGIRGATDAAAASDAAYSVIEYPNGAQLRIQDGEFIPGNRGVPDSTPAPSELPAADRTPSIEAPRKQELVGAGTHTPPATAHTSENRPPQAHNEAPQRSPGGEERASGPNGPGGHGSASPDITGDAPHGPGHPADPVPPGHGGGGRDSAQGGELAADRRPAPVKEWQAADDIVGTARGKLLLYPNYRHELSGVRSGAVDTKNTVILPEARAKVRQDIAEIAAGRAQFNAQSQLYSINGRRYAVEPSGRIFPVDGPGFIDMNRIEYNALKQIMRADGDMSKVQVMFSKAPQFRDNPEAVKKAIDLYRKYYP